MGDMRLPISAVNGMWSGQLIHRDAMNPIEPAGLVHGDEAEDDVFAVAVRLSTSLYFVERRGNLKEP